jgi:hypothetical protein
MLKVEKVQATVNAVTPVAKKMGNSGSYETAMSISLIFITSADHLDQMEKGLRKSLYKKVSKHKKAQVEGEEQGDLLPNDNGELTVPKFGKKLPSIPWADELEGYLLIAGSGLTATEPRGMEGTKLKNFTITAQDGGTIKIQCSASFECDRESKGWWCEQLRSTIELSLIPPGETQSEAFEEEEEEFEEPEFTEVEP